MKIVETYWRSPISIRLQSGLSRTFHSVEDTLEFLENEWPNRSGPHQRRATELCRAAMNRTAPVQVAREAVIAACMEAGMPLAASFQQRTQRSTVLHRAP